MKIKYILALLLLTSCETPVLVSTGEDYSEEATVSCQHPGYCMTCMPGGVDLSMKCGFKFSAFCPGTKEVLQQVTPEVYQYKSGKKITRQRVVIIKDLRGCL